MSTVPGFFRSGRGRRRRRGADPTPPAARPWHRSRGAREPAPDSEGPGYAYEGPGFYVWDEESRCAREWALELAHLAPRRKPAGGPQR